MIQAPGYCWDDFKVITTCLNQWLSNRRPMIQNFLQLQVTNFCNKLECLLLLRFSSLVYCFWARPEAVFLVVYDPSLNELWVTYTHRDLSIGLSKSLTAHSKKGRTWLKMQPQEPTLEWSTWKVFLGWASALPTNTILSWKGLRCMNTLAYYKIL